MSLALSMFEIHLADQLFVSEFLDHSFGHFAHQLLSGSTIVQVVVLPQVSEVLMGVLCHLY